MPVHLIYEEEMITEAKDNMQLGIGADILLMWLFLINVEMLMICLQMCQNSCCWCWCCCCCFYWWWCWLCFSWCLILSTISVLPLSILYFNIYVCCMFNKITFLLTWCWCCVDQQGLRHYKDLSMAVTRSEADELARIVLAETTNLVPGATVELVGGFRR